MAHCERVRFLSMIGVLGGPSWDRRSWVRPTPPAADPPRDPDGWAAALQAIEDDPLVVVDGPPGPVDLGLPCEVMEAPEERVELILTVHAPIDCALLARLAQVVAAHSPGARAEGVDDESDIVFVVPVAASVAPSEPATGSPVLSVVSDPSRTSQGRSEADPDPVGPEASPISERGGVTGIVEGIAAPVILDPAYGDAPTRARRLAWYLAALDLDPSVPADVEAAKDSHRRGVLWKDSGGAWHCPWCDRTTRQAGPLGRHRSMCPHRPSGPLDVKMLREFDHPAATLGT